MILLLHKLKKSNKKIHKQRTYFYYLFLITMDYKQAMQEKFLINKYYKDWFYKLNMEDLKNLHKNTDKKDLIKIIAQLMDAYNRLNKNTIDFIDKRLLNINQ